MERYYACLICIAKGDWNCGNIVCSTCRYKHTTTHQHCMKEYRLKKSQDTCDMCNGSMIDINNEQTLKQKIEELTSCCKK